MDFKNLLEKVKTIMEIKLIDMEKFDFAIYHIFIIATIIVVTYVILWLVKKLITGDRLSSKMEKGKQFALYQIVKYIIIIIAITIGFEALGIKVTLLLAGSAALLVGIGLGLQEVFKDIVSGIFILVEGSVKVGDIIEVDQIVGRVTEIGLRASEIETRDRIIMIIPNSKFVNHNVINWTHNIKTTRFHLKVGVAYGSDVEKVRGILEQVASNHDAVEKHPAPYVHFKDFGESALIFDLLFFSQSVFRIENTLSDLRYQIDREFRAQGVTIPFPQRDLHFRSQFKEPFDVKHNK